MLSVKHQPITEGELRVVVGFEDIVRVSSIYKKSVMICRIREVKDGREQGQGCPYIYKISYRNIPLDSGKWRYFSHVNKNVSRMYDKIKTRQTHHSAQCAHHVVIGM